MAFALTLLFALGSAAPAVADPLSAKRAQAARIQSQVTALNNRAEVAAEKYNAAKMRYSAITKKVRATNRKIAKIKKRQHTLQTHLNTRAEDAYREGPFGFLTVLLGARTFEQFETTARIVTSLNQQDAANVEKLKATKAEAQAVKKVLVAEQKEAASHKRDMASNAQQVQVQLEARRRVLASVTSEIQALMASRIAEQSAAQQARVMRTMLRTRTPASGGIVFGVRAAPSEKAAEAVYWAEKQLGKPYVWAADGPDTFDCSGLMLFAYAKVGVKLSHYSGSQIHEGKRVSRSSLLPGDLVFFGSPIHHVGMYVGGGNFLEAPYSGANVCITKLSERGDYAGACRPAP
jgi:cell wall-associated NlpC family hydrolase